VNCGVMQFNFFSHCCDSHLSINILTYKYLNVATTFELLPLPDFISMTKSRANKRPRDEDSEDSEVLESDGSGSFSEDDNPHPPSQGKKRSKLNANIVRSTALKKLQTAPRGSIGIPAIRALLAKSGSLSKFTAASRETNSGLRKEY
jgi:hypothetical protein